MGKMGFHFRRHGHCGHKSASCHETDKWSGWRKCASKGQGGKEHPSGNVNHGSCNGHHHHHHHFGKWGSNGLMRKFQHSHCHRMQPTHHHHMQPTHHHHMHPSHHHQKHGHHAHCHQHGHERCSQHSVEREPMGNRQGHNHWCCNSQSKACQTEPSVEEAPECNPSQASEKESDQAST